MTGKFSIADKLGVGIALYAEPTTEREELLNELYGFAHYLAAENVNNNLVVMQYDELVGELLLEIAKGLKHYQDKSGKELYYLLKTMMDHRIGELKHRNYLTHRKAYAYMDALDDSSDADDDQDADGVALLGDKSDEGVDVADDTDVESLIDSAERVRMTREQLSPNGRKVFDAMIHGDKRLAMIIGVSILRASQVFKNPGPAGLPKPWQLADALLMEERDIRSAIKEIRVAYAAVLDELGGD